MASVTKPIPDNNKSWLIESQSLLVADGSSDCRRLYVKQDQGSSRGTLTTTSRHGRRIHQLRSRLIEKDGLKAG